MADEEFFTLDDDDFHEEQESQTSKDKNSKEDTKNSKTIYYLIIALLTLIIIFFALFLYLYIQKKDKKELTPEVNASLIIETIQNKELSPRDESRAQKLLKKADHLYSIGKKDEALKIYEEISLYNKALSHYNIGVAKLKEKRYKEAIRSFDKAMQSNALKCASALNSAVCALNLKESSLFKQYLSLSEKYLPYMLNKPLYSYYLSLINYYKNRPYEALVSIENPTSQFYKDEQNFIASKVVSSFQNDSLSISYLNKIDDPKNALTKALLHARVGEYSLAEKYLQSAINQGFEPLRSNIALALVKNKLGLLKDSGEILKSTYDAYKERAENIYPISVELKKSLFDPVLAQKEFKKRLFLSDKYKYSLLFYYAPYRAINSTNSADFITKGAKDIYISNTKPALNYLKNSKAISSTNIAITKALKNIIENKIYEANAIFKDVITLYPAHATLHYNLALSYAQIFDFLNAYKHFSKSYSLDSSNYLALIFKTFCAKLTNKDIPIKELEKLKLNTDSQEALRLVEIALGSLGLNFGYLDSKNSTFKTAINLLFAYNRADLEIYKKSAQELKALLKSDLVSNILYLDATEDKSKIKAYAKAIQESLTNKNLDLTPLYFGGFLPKELYIQMLSIAGIVSIAKKTLNSYAKTAKPTIPLLQSQAYSDIYNQDFNQAYDIYNQLIDKYNQKDTHTLFLASVAAIGANHPENAIALLELSKLTDSSNYESRYALGLLYQEAKNLEGASIQYKKIANDGFISQYFTFKIKK